MNTEKFHTKGLRYNCNQRIEDFAKEEKGFFCSICHRELIDFRDKSKAEYYNIIKNNTEGCGIFYSNQIGDEIEINWKKPLMALSFYFAFLFNNPIQAQSTSETKIELSDSTSSNKKDTILLSDKCTSPTTSDKPTLSSKNKSHNKNRHRKRLYLSKKFPFIHYNRYRYATAGYW